MCVKAVSRRFSGEMKFDGKSAKTGDEIKVRAEASQPSGGTYGSSFTFDSDVHKYKHTISLDETGCDLPGFSCD